MVSSPFDDELLACAEFIDFDHRLECTFTSVEYFIGTYSYILGDKIAGETSAISAAII